MKVAVIGAGAIGLPAIKCCLDEVFDVVCFEKRDDVGGVWYYQEESKHGEANVMRMTVTVTNKESMSYSDFVVPREFPVYLPHTKVLEYYRMYTDRFQLRQHIRFMTEVTRVKQAADFSSTGRWEVTSKDLTTGRTTTEMFDAVMICQGHQALPCKPQFDNEEAFEGEILHSHYYRHNEKYKNKRIVVVGCGNSAVEVACDLANAQSKVYMTIRSGSWFTGYLSNGRPYELTFLKRSVRWMDSIFPQAFGDWQKRTLVNSRVDHKLFGLEPDYEVLRNFATLSDDLPVKILSGMVQIKPTIRRLTRKGVEFTDGSTAEDIDAIVCATGYECSFSFVDHEAFATMKSKRDVNLYKLIFPPDIYPSTIAVIGFIDHISSGSGVGELQSRYVAGVFKGTVKLPGAETMRRSVAKDREMCRSLHPTSLRQFIYREPISYSDDLALAIGCRPPAFLRLLLTDPKLAMSVYFSPHTFHQYRLVGPGAWPGARDAVIGSTDRLLYPLLASGRSSLQKSGGDGMIMTMVAAGILAAISVAVFLKL